MHDYSKEHRKHGEVKSIMLESRVKTPFGKDYWFQIYLCHRFYKVPKVYNPFRRLSDCGITSSPTTFVRKSRLSVVSRIN